MRYFFGILLLYSNWLSLCFGQKPFQLAFDPALNDKISAELIPVQCADSLDLIFQTNRVISHLQAAGYLSAVQEAYELRDSIFNIKLDPGPLFTWLTIDPGNVPEQILDECGLNLRLMKKKPVQAAIIASTMNQILDHYSDLGFPFVQIRLDSVVFTGNDVSARLNLTRNKQIIFDTLQIVSRTNISVNYLEKLLGIRPGLVFNASRLKSIPARIGQLPFLALKNPPEVQFSGNKAIVKLNLEEKKVSRFDLLIGLQQDDIKPGKVKIAGEMAAEMQNRLGQGEYVGLNYKNRGANVQELNLQFNYPFLFNLPFSVNAGFKMFQNNDLFRNLDFNAGVSYPLGEFSDLGVFWHSTGSRLISIDTATLLNTRKLPAQLDVGVNGLGLQLNFEKLDYRFNPRKGWQFALESTAGIKNVIPNIEIQSLKNELVDFNNSYDTIRGGTQFSLAGQLSWFQPIGKLVTLKISNASGWKFSQHGLFRNEAFRIGGNRILRGFDEESLFVRGYSVFTLEPRLIIGRNSWFFVFGEMAALNLMDTVKTKIDYPYSLGTGLSFDTKAGVLLISAAVGSLQGSGLDFNATRVHIGYVSLF